MNSSPTNSPAPLQEGTDYYIENGRYVFTAHYLLKRGYCCQSGCRHCPYGFEKNAVPPVKDHSKEPEISNKESDLEKIRQ